MLICKAEPSDASEILSLQKRAYLSEAEIYNDFNLAFLRHSKIHDNLNFIYMKKQL